MKKTIELSLEKARELYGKNTEMDQLLLANFSEKELTKKDWRELKTFTDCLESLGIEKIFNWIELNETTDEFAYRQLKIIVKAINQGWVPDWKDSSQYKYFPWFEIDKASCFGLFVDLSASSVDMALGSRLCFESSEKAKYAAEQFIDIYKQFFL